MEVKKKRWLVAGFISFLIMGLTSFAFALDISPQPVSAKPGDSIVLNINIDSGVTSMDAWGFVLHYDADVLEYTSPQGGSPPAGQDFGSDEKTGTINENIQKVAGVASGTGASAVVNISALDFSGGVTTSAGGIFIKIKFNVKAAADHGFNFTIDSFVSDIAGATSSPAAFSLTGIPTGAITLTPDPASILANGSAETTITSGAIKDGANNNVPDDTLITVVTDKGTIATSQDQDAGEAGIQRKTVGGVISFVLTASNAVETAKVDATSVKGNAAGTVNVPFTPPPPAKFAITGPTTTVAGTAQTYTITAQDNLDQTKTDFNGPVNLACSDANAVCPATVTLTSGVGTVDVTFKTVGSGTQTLTATLDPATSGPYSVTVTAGTATKIRLTPATSTVNTNGSDTTKLKAEMMDDNGNVDTDNTDKVTFTITQAKDLVVFKGDTTVKLTKEVDAVAGVAEVELQGLSTNTETDDATVKATTTTSVADSDSVTITVIDKTLESIAIETVPAGTTSTTVGKKVLFKATGTYDDASEEVITDTVTWADSATKGEFSTTTKGEFLAKADGTTDITASLDGKTSPKITLTIKAADPLAFDLPDTMQATDSLDLTKFASGGSGDFTFSVTVEPEAGAVKPADLAADKLVFDQTKAFAGSYTIKVTDNIVSGSEKEDTIKVPLILKPFTFQELAGSANKTFVISGAPTSTAFTVEKTGDFVGTLDESTLEYTFPATVDANKTFTLKFTATGLAGVDPVTGTYTVIKTANNIEGIVIEDGSSPEVLIGNATAVLVETGAVDTTPDTGDDKGKFSFENLPAGTYTVTVSAAGYFSKTVSADSWPSDNKIKLVKVTAADGKIEGVVKDPSDNLLDEVLVQVKKDGALLADASGKAFSAYTNADGKYSFSFLQEDVAAGDIYTVVFKKDGFVTNENLTPKLGILENVANGATDADFTLRPTTKITILASDLSGEDAGKVQFAITANDKAFDGTKSNADDGEIRVKINGEANYLALSADNGADGGLFFTGKPFPGAPDVNIWSFKRDKANFSFAVEADVTDTTRDVSDNSYKATVTYNYVKSGTSSDAGPFDRATAIKAQSTSGDIIVIIPPGSIPAGISNDVIIEIIEADTVEAGAEGHANGSKKIYQVQVIDPDDPTGTPISNINDVQISIRYDSGKITGDDDAVKNLLKTGQVKVLKAANIVTLAANQNVTAVAYNEQEFLVANGFITFEVDSLSGFGISGVSELVAPVITKDLTPSTGAAAGGYEVKIEGTGFANVDKVMVGSTTLVKDTEWTINTEKTIITIPSFPAGTAGASVAVKVFVGDLVSSKNFTYSGGGTTPPGPVVTGPTANFDADVKSGEAPLTVKFTDKSSSGTSSITKWEWNFGDEDSGDDNISTEEDPTHIYTKAGSYKVTLKVTTSVSSDSEIKSDYITVTAKAPTASFTMSPDAASVQKGTTVSFTDTSTGEITSRTWTVGGVEFDGVSHIFNEVGTFTVALKVVGPGGENTASKQIQVTEVVVTAGFDFSVNGLTVTFTNTSTGHDGQVWQFGDGKSSNEANPVHPYATAGTYEVSLVVASSAGATDAIKKNVTVTGGVTPEKKIEANFTVNKTSGLKPLMVQFSDESSSTNTTVTTWAWSFGDGESSSVQNPSHTYTKTGSYTVTLTAGDGAGTSDTEIKTGYIKVGEFETDPPVPVSPADDMTDVKLRSTILEIAPFADFYAFWEIATDAGFAENTVVWREKKGESATLEIPRFILEDSQTDYWWRVRFVGKDNGLPKSDWSAVYKFTTVMVADNDSNSDGILDSQTVENPSGIFPNVDQSGFVKFVKAAVGNGVFALEGLDNVTGIVFLEAFGTNEVSVPANTEMPWGLIGYKIDVETVGAEAKVRIHFSEAVDANAKWFAYQSVEKWQDYSVLEGKSEFSADRKSLVLTLQDGGFGDEDGIENGIIVVPLSGFGIVTVVETSGGGGSDTCFIGAASQGGFGAGFALLTLLAGAVSAFCVRKQTK